MQAFCCILRNFKGIGHARRHGIKFLFDPVERIFRINLAAMDADRQGPGNEFMVADGNRDFRQDFFDGLSPAQDDRQAFRFFIRSRDQFCTVRFNRRRRIVNRIAQCLNPGSRFRKAFS